MIDTHAHIYLEQFNEDLGEVIERSLEVGMQKIYMPNIDHTSIDNMLEVEEQYNDLCIATMGLHPCSVKADFEKELYLVEDWLSKRAFAAIGEIGTDLYWDKTFIDQQEEAFKIQSNWAIAKGIPIIIHCRESLDLTIDLVEQLQDENFSGVFHCFNGNVEQAKRISDLGFYIGLGGVSTFKNAGMDKVIPHIDLEKIVLETDSPYLAPVPHRGKRNEPSYTQLVAQRVADLKEMPITELLERTTENSLKLFKADDSTSSH